MSALRDSQVNKFEKVSCLGRQMSPVMKGRAMGVSVQGGRRGLSTKGRGEGYLYGEVTWVMVTWDNPPVKTDTTENITFATALAAGKKKF